MEGQNVNIDGPAVKKKLVPDALTAMILGIVSIVTMMYFGWIASIIGFSKRRKALALYEANPSQYSEKSLGILRTAKTLNTIGLIVSIISTVLFILYIVVLIAVLA
jgi:hypothetical protein